MWRFECSAPGCGRSFQSINGVSRHQKSCSFVAANAKRVREDVRNRRREAKKAKASHSRAELASTSTSFGEVYDGSEPVPELDTPERAPMRPVAEPEPPTLSAAGRVVRRRVLPARYRDMLPDVPAREAVIETSPSTEEDVGSGAETEAANDVPFRLFRSDRNRFGLCKVFRRDLYSVDRPAGTVLNEVVSRADESAESNPYAPHPNYSSFLFNQWFWTGGIQKTLKEGERLQKIIGSDDFIAKDILQMNMQRVCKLLGNSTLSEFFDPQDGWVQSTLKVPVPLGHLGDKVPLCVDFEIDQFFHRPLVGVIRSVFESPQKSAGFCYEPYELRFQSPYGGEEMAVHGELYASKVFRDAHEEVQRLPRDPDDNLPRAVVAMQLWSDGMSAAKFGNAKLWPAYLQFGNQSKYERSESGSCHHIAHIPSLPSGFKDFVLHNTHGKPASDALETHCRRELMHCVWKAILDDDFLHAWRHGMIVLCGDGVTRRLYPRILTYSADYPEKVLLATIKHLGKHPCPRCLVKSDTISSLGKRTDAKFRIKHARVDDASRRYNVEAARDLIYKKRRHVGHANVTQLLDKYSLTPVENAFSTRLGPLGFDYHSMLVVDVMHEWEVGIWRQIFTHLVRILDTFRHSQLNKVHELDRRVRTIPAFSDSIRRYSGNISEMKQMTAYSFEDLLQCALPVFEGLLPEPHETIVRELIYHAATVHALAKLRIHTDATVAALDSETRLFGFALRRFKEETCSVFVTSELSTESQKRLRRSRRKEMGDNIDNDERIRASLKKSFNINTSKIHAIGDYARHIILYGTTDSYSTAIGETEHKKSKQNYLRTNRVNYVRQMTEIQRIQSNLAYIAEKANDNERAHLGPESVDDEPASDGKRYSIGAKGTPYLLNMWLEGNAFDPALEDFRDLLEEHIFARLKNLDCDDDELQFSADDRADVVIIDNRIYEHKRLGIDYTTYDLQRKRDSVNPTSITTDVMLLSRDSDVASKSISPFWYARVIGIYHVETCLRSSGSNPTRLDFLWVRWFGRTVEDKFGDDVCRLERIRFVTKEDESPLFGFVDPAAVVRAVHLIPAFHYERTDALLPPSRLARRREPDEIKTDWESFYVNKFADRDLFMHHRGGGVGHTTGHNAEDANRVPPDMYGKLGIHRTDDEDYEMGVEPLQDDGMGLQDEDGETDEVESEGLAEDEESDDGEESGDDRVADLE